MIHYNSFIYFNIYKYTGDSTMNGTLYSSSSAAQSSPASFVRFLDAPLIESRIRGEVSQLGRAMRGWVTKKKRERKKERTNERKKASKKEKNCLSFFRQSTSIPMISWINYSDSLCNRGRNAVEQTRAHTYTGTRAQEQQQKQHESSRDSLDLHKNNSLKHTNAGRQKA